MGAVLTGLLLAATVGCSGGVGRQGAAGATVIRPAGCPPPGERAHDDAPDGTPVSDAQPPERTRTVANHANGIELDVPEAVRRVRALVGDAQPVAAHTLRGSGIRVEILSDGPVQVDAGALEEAFAAPFEVDAYGDAEMRAVMACYHDRIALRRDLAGTRVRLLVATDPTACLHRLVRGVDAPPGTPCRSGGVTLPAMELSLGGVVRLSGSALIVLAPAAAERDHDRPSRAVTRVLLHELVHLYDNAAGLFPRPGELMAYEQRASYVEDALIAWYRDQGRDLPEPVRFIRGSGS